MVKVTDEYHPPDADYWEEIMPQFDLDDAVAEVDLMVEEVTCNMIEPELMGDGGQDREGFCTGLQSQALMMCFPWKERCKTMMISNRFMMMHV